MKIVIATSNSPFSELTYTRSSVGGAERGLRTYGTFASQRHDVVYLSTAHRGLHMLPHYVEDEVDGMQVIHLVGPSVPGLQKTLRKARERAWMSAVTDVCRTHQADVVLTYATIPDTLAAVRAKQELPHLRVVEWMAGRSWELHLNRVPGDLDRVAEAMQGKDLTLVETDALSAYTESRLAALGLPTLGNRERVAFAAESNDFVSPVTSAQWPGATGPIVSCMAAFKPGSKRQDILIRAWPRVISDYGPATLVMTGDGPLRGDAEAIVKELGISEYVQFAGLISREALASLVHSSTVTVLPTEFEGRPHSILESFAAGVPVVASDIPAVREALACLGDAREYCLAQNSPEGFASRIVRMLQDDALRQRVQSAISVAVEGTLSQEDSLAGIDAAISRCAEEGR